MPVAPCTYCGSTEGPDHLCPGKNLELVGQVLDGRYRIEGVLGQGGMGMVFQAVQTSVQRPVAVKTLHATLAAAPQFFERFKREAEMASRLRHPNIITIYDFGRTKDGACYYVMELVEGESLKQLVKREGPLPLGRAVNLIEQAARALGHAHENGVIHRDVKPHNMMVQRLDQQDFVKVLDFGLVKALEQDENQQLTSTGQVLGTPQYMPPEQAGGEQVDQRSDLYSLAGVLYYCLTGSSPFGANTVRKALQAALTQTVPPVGKKRLGAPVPHELDEFFRKALAREKEDRYQDAAELVAELKQAVSGCTREELEARPTPPDPAHPSGREGSGSGSQAKDRGTVASRRSGSGSQSRSPSRSRPSNIVVDPEVDRPAAAAAKKGGKTGLWVALPLLVAALGGAAYLLLRPAPLQPLPQLQVVEVPSAPQPGAPGKMEAEPPAPVPARPAQVSVHFESDPPGAGIYDGEAQIGTTPTDLRFERSRVLNLTFRLSGHRPVEKTLDFSRLEGDQMTVPVALQKLAPAQPASSRKKASGSEDIPVFE